MMGMLRPSCFSLDCNSRPDIFGMRMSMIKHAASPRESDSRNAFADPKHRASSHPDSIRSFRESCIDSLSSMMAINLDVWPPGMARTQYRWDQSQRCTSVYLRDGTGVNGTAVTLR